MHLFELAAQHRSWLGLRQATVAQNVANANTPGYKARAVPDFDKTLTAMEASQTTTHAAHFAFAGGQAAGAAEAAEPTAVTHSGNSVDLEHELLTAGETNRSYALNVSVVKTFRRMMMASLRS
jgi:flagellar basal-body rod protein FlgB